MSSGLKIYVKQSGERVGEAVLIGNTYHVHVYDTGGSLKFELGKIPKKYKLEVVRPQEKEDSSEDC